MSSMKIINRIAPFLIALILGITTFPRVQAIERMDDIMQKPTKTEKTKNFHGIRIYPNLVDDLLFSESNIKTVASTTGAVLYSQHDQVTDAVNLPGELSHENLQFQEQHYSKNDSDGKCNKSGNSFKR